MQGNGQHEVKTYICEIIPFCPLRGFGSSVILETEAAGTAEAEAAARREFATMSGYPADVIAAVEINEQERARK